MKRALTIQDLSCVGKCSLSVALPIISAAGVETAVIPTAVLSAHTAFDGFTLHELTDDIDGIARHWKSEKLGFDCIYTGYLASTAQLEKVGGVIDTFGESAYILVDPVMGDFGRLYTGFTPDFPEEMLSLCSRADLILPNITEACALTGAENRDSATPDECVEMAKKLCAAGAKRTVVTGVSPSNDKLGAVMYDSVSGESFSYFGEKIKADFPLHGTGDIFASVTAAAIMRGKSEKSALAAACDFTAECVRRTVNNPAHRWYGVDFEGLLCSLPEMIDKY